MSAIKRFNDSLKMNYNFCLKCILIFRKNLGDNLSSELLHQSLASGLYGGPSKIELVTGGGNNGGGGVGIQPFEDTDSSFQYVLTAPTSIATKVKILLCLFEKLNVSAKVVGCMCVSFFDRLCILSFFLNLNFSLYLSICHIPVM